MAEKTSVLYIEDEPDLLMIGKLFLEKKAGFTVHTSTSADAALDLIQEQQYDAIISDYLLPGMDGIALLKELRSSGITAPFILYSGRAREEVVIQALNFGADYYLQKAGEPEELFARLIDEVRSAVTRWRAECDLVRKNEELTVANKNLVATETELRAQIQEYARHEAVLHITEKRLLWSQEIGKTGSWEYDPKTNAIWGSAEGLHIFGFPPVAGNFPIHEIEACIPERVRVNQALVDLIIHDIPYDLEYLIHPADDSDDKVIHSVARAEKDSAGNLVRVVGIIQDVTRQKTLEHDQQVLIASLGETNECLESAYEELAGSEEELRTQYNSLAETEEQLRKSTEYLENLFTIANVPIIVWDPLFRIVRINHACELIIGRYEAEIIGTPLQHLFSPDQEFRVTRLLETTHSGVRWETVEVPVLHRDGSERTIVWNTATLFDTDGATPVATIAQGRDVTEERRHAHAKDTALVEIQKNLAQLSILNDGIRNPLTIIVTCADLLDDDAMIDTIMVQAQRIDMMVNNLDQRWIESEKVLNTIRKHYQIEIHPQTDSMQGNGGGTGDYSASFSPTSGSESCYVQMAEEVQAQLYAIFDSIDALVYVVDMESYDLLFINQRGRTQFGNIAGKKCYQVLFPGQETPCTFCTNHLLTEQGRPTGVHRWEFNNTLNGRWFDCRDRAIRWNDGRLVRLEISTDITGRKQTEALLRESKERLSTIFSVAQVGIILIDAGTHEIIEVNPKAIEMIGAPKEEIIGRVCHTFICPAECSRCPVTDLHQAVYTSERVLINRNGDQISILITVAQQQIGGRNVFIESFVDITQLRQTEQTLRESERRYREIFESLDDLYFQTDENGIITVLSPSVSLLSGWTPDELMGTPVVDLYVYPEDRATLHGKLKPYGYIKDYELLLKKRDGTPIPVSLSGSVILNADGTFGGLQGSLRDISARKCVEDALLESEEKYRAISEYSHQAICIVDSQARIIWANEEMIRMGGYPLEIIYAADSFAQFLAPESLAFVIDNFQKCMRGDPYEHQYTFSIIRADGEKRRCSKHMTDFTDRHGKKNLIISMLDITEKEQMQEALQESENRFRSILQNVSTVAVQGYRMDGTVRYWNRASETFYGYSAEEALNKNLLDLIIPPEMRTGVTCAIQQMIDTGEVIPASELELMRNDGSRIPVYSSHVIVKMPDGDDELYCIDIDLTERKKAEESLFASNQKLRLLTSLTRHDIMNKLGAIHLLHDVALEEYDPVKRDYYLIKAREITKQIEDIIRFTREYEEFGSVSSGWQQVEPLIRDAALESSHADTLIRVTIPPDIEFYGDPIIRKVFSTLIENAVRHGGTLTQVTFSWSTSESYLSIWCDDDGVGIPCKEKELIFAHGFGKHTGMGLFLAREILAITGLSIREIGDPGKGARFEIQVPEGKWRRKNDG